MPDQDQIHPPNNSNPPEEAPSAEARIAALEAQLDKERRTVAHLKRRGEIEALLREAEAIDLETAATLVEADIANEEPDGGAAQAVADLKRRKPFLFVAAAPPPSVASALRIAPSSTRSVEHAATEAQVSGNRTDLMRYLRLRRAIA